MGSIRKSCAAQLKITALVIPARSPRPRFFFFTIVIVIGLPLLEKAALSVNRSNCPAK